VNISFGNFHILSTRFCSVSGPHPAGLSPPWTMQVNIPTSEVQAAVGPANFQPNDFVIFNKIGALNVRNVTCGSIQGAMDTSRQKEGPTTRVNVFAATYESGKPFQGPVTVVLKEFLPGSRGVGLNELNLLSTMQVTYHPLSSSVAVRWPTSSNCRTQLSSTSQTLSVSTVMQSLPEQQLRWKMASAEMSDTSVVPLLGWFESATSDVPEDSNNRDQDSLWLVLKFEGLQPAQGFAQPMPQQGPAKRGFAIFSLPQDTPVRRRCEFLQALFSGVAPRA
jgi:hypothetical protein